MRIAVAREIDPGVPMPTVAVAPSASILRILLNFASDKLTPNRCGKAPPESPVPAPRATIGTPSA